jgi:hypothetical protein
MKKRLPQASKPYVGTRDVHIPRDLERKLNNSNNPNRVVSSTKSYNYPNVGLNIKQTHSAHIENNQLKRIQTTTSKSSSRSPPPLIGSMDTSHILDTNINPYTGKKVHPVTADHVSNLPLNYKSDPELKKDFWYQERVGFTTAQPKGGGDPINITYHQDVRNPPTSAGLAWSNEPSKKWWEL